MSKSWMPPQRISREQIVRTSASILSQPELPIKDFEDDFRLQSLELDWDIGGKVYEPSDPEKIATGPDGKRIGIFLLHGGSGDHHGKDRMARFLASRFGYKVATMTYPGRLNFHAPDHKWPGDTVNPDGTVRTPVWKIDEPITPDQYDVIQDRSNPVYRAKWGTLYMLNAKEGTPFYNRMASWPVAFDEAMQAVCHRNFPADEYSIYAHGHSTGGPFVHILLQRVDNVVGLLGMESSQWGFLYPPMLEMTWDYPFNYLTLRTWRHLAMYAGPEAGPDLVWRLPWVMEEVLEAWDRQKSQPQFKAEYIVTYGATDALAEAGKATARRLGLNAEDTNALVERFTGYARELSGPGVKPVPPLLYGITQGSRDHTLQRYQEILLPAVAAMEPAPKANIVFFEAGVHSYERAEEDLPHGLLPAIAQLWDDAIGEGYFLA